MDPIKKYYRSFAYVAGFFLTIHFSFPSYFNATFLNKFLPESGLGLIFSIASFIAIIALPRIIKLINKIGQIKVAILLAAINILITFPMIFSDNSLLVVLFFLIYYAIGILVKFDLDLYLETLSNDENTGGIRGIFMTAINFAWLLSPLLAGLLVGDNNFRLVYLISALSLVPFIYFMWRKSKNFSTGPTKEFALGESIRKLVELRGAEHKNIYNILIVDFLLNLFYAIMVVYTAMYLQDYIHISAPDIGIIFTIMLIPFVLLEYPMGKIADKYLGEKEMLTLGLIFTGAATLFIPFITTSSLIVWAVILFATRVGASAIEIMKETYLFKQIGSENTEILCISRDLQPLSYIVGPILGSLFISAIGLKYLFLLLGIIMIFGVRFSLRLKDTK